MPEITVDDGVRLHYVERGEGETVVLSHSYIVDHHHFDPQIEALSASYHVVAYDHRGHGRSDKPRGGYSMERIYADGVALLEALDRGPVHWIGLSTGGFVGMRLAYRRPELLRSLVLMDTAASSEDLLPHLKYEALFIVLRFLGFTPVLGPAMASMFGPAFLKDPHRDGERARWRQRFRENDARAIIAFGKAIFSREDVTHRLREIKVPTLVTVGAQDRATTPAKARKLAATIPGARLEYIPRGGHLCTVEEPETVNRVLLEFLEQQA